MAAHHEGKGSLEFHYQIVNFIHSSVQYYK